MIYSCKSTSFQFSLYIKGCSLFIMTRITIRPSERRLYNINWKTNIQLSCKSTSFRQKYILEYHSVHKIRTESIMKSPIYFEKQRGGLCGMIALNNVFQEQVFKKAQLDYIATELDKELIQIEPDYRNQPSINFSPLGYYNGQVLEIATKCVKGRELLNINSNCARAKTAQACTKNESGFIVGTGNHWFALRNFCDQWYCLDSLKPAPEPMTVTGNHLDIFSTKQKRDGYKAIYVVV